MDLVLDLNYFSFSNHNQNPNPTHLPKHQIQIINSPTHTFSERTWYVEYYSVHSVKSENYQVSNFAWHRSWNKSEICSFSRTRTTAIAWLGSYDSSPDLWWLDSNHIEEGWGEDSNGLTFFTEWLDSTRVTTNDWSQSHFCKISEHLIDKPSLFAPEMITIRFAGWISGRIVSLQPDKDIQKKALKWEPDPDIRNAFINISRIQTFGKFAHCKIIHLLSSEASFQLSAPWLRVCLWCNLWAVEWVMPSLSAWICSWCGKIGLFFSVH